MQHLRFFVVVTTNAMSAVFAYDTEALAVRYRLNGMTNIAQGCSGSDRVNPGERCLVSGVHQALRGRADVSHEIHPAGITKPTILDHSHVNIDDIPILENIRRRWDSVADHSVRRNTGGFGKAVIADVRWNNLQLIDDIRVTNLIQRFSADASFDMTANHGEHIRSQPSGNPKLDQIIFSLDADTRTHYIASRKLSIDGERPNGVTDRTVPPAFSARMSNWQMSL